MSPELRKILCPVDFSECSRKAVDYARFLAQRFDSEVTLFHVWASPVSLYPELSVWVNNAETTLAQAVEAHAQSEMKRVADSLPDEFRARVQTEIVCGSPLQSIVERATSGAFDLIVLGTHGHTGFMHLLVGSVAERVVQHAPCPVLTVRGPKHERE